MSAPAELTFPEITLFSKHGQRMGSLRVHSEEGFSWRPSGQGKPVNVPPEDISSLQWYPLPAKRFELRIHSRSLGETQLQGFVADAFERLAEFCGAHQKQGFCEIERIRQATEGWNWGTFTFNNADNTLDFEIRDGEKVGNAFSVRLNGIAQSVIQGKNEVAIMFQQDDKALPQEETLVEMRVYVPDSYRADEDEAGGDEENEVREGEEPASAVEKFNREVTRKAGIDQAGADSIASFGNLLFSVPRGRYEIDMFANNLKLHGKTFSYKILYSSISKLFLFESPDQQHMVLIIALDPPIRQGRTSYPHLLMQFGVQDSMTLKLNMDEKTIQEKYPTLARTIQGPTYDIVTRVFKALTDKKVIVPGTFRSTNGVPCVRCTYKNNEGFLYLLEFSFFFIKKPPIFIRHSEVNSLEFLRIDAMASGTSRSFDLLFTLKEGGGSITFGNIDRKELGPLHEFLSERKITILNARDVKDSLGGRVTKRVGGEGDDFVRHAEGEAASSGSGSEDEEDEEDEDFEVGSGSSSESVESEEGSDMAEEVERASGDELIVKETLGETRAKAKKKSSAGGSGKKKKAKSKVKQARSAYMFFSQATRKQVAEENPSAGFAEIGKITGQRWKEISAEEKKKYEEMALEDKKRAEKEKAEEEKRWAEQGDQEEEEEEKGGKKAKGKRGKGKKARKEGPKKAANAYALYVKEMCHKVKEEKPELKAAEVLKQVAEKWKELSLEEKAPYLEEANADKERYKRELAEWNEKVKEKETGDNEKADEGDDEEDMGAGEAEEGEDGEEKKKRKKHHHHKHSHKKGKVEGGGSDDEKGERKHKKHKKHKKHRKDKEKSKHKHKRKEPEKSDGKAEAEPEAEAEAAASSVDAGGDTEMKADEQVGEI